MEQKAKARGRSRMRELGRKEVVVWLDPNEVAVMTAAAIAAGQQLATWIREQAFRAAEAAAIERVRTDRREARGE